MDLKKRIFDKEGLEPSRQNLVLNGKFIHNEDDASIEKLEIPNESTIFLVVRLPGGNQTEDK
jgi:hypothetical protein